MSRTEFLPHRIEGIRTASLASDDTLRLCRSERDAFLVSMTLSGMTYDEVGARLGVSKQAVNKWGRQGVPHKRVRAFCNATGTRLLEQFLAWERAKVAALGSLREADRIALIAQGAAA